MNRSWLAAASILLAFILASCSSTKVSTEKAPNADLARYHSYSWAPPDQLEQPGRFSSRFNDILDQQIKSEVNKDLSGKGFVIDPAQADLRVAYAAKTKNELQVEPGYYPTPYWDGQTYNQVVEQRLGTLALDFIDNKTGKLVWQGIAVTNISETGATSEQVHDAIDKIMKNFPDHRTA